MRIAILGATSQIAKDLVVSFSKYDDHELVLFARNTHVVDQWLVNVGLTNRYVSKSYEEIDNQKPFEALINFVGVGDPAKAIEMGSLIFDVTYKYDNLAINYLRQHPDCRYLFLSSGAVYGSNFEKPVDENTEAKISVNNLQPSDWYGVAKLYAECRHRALTEFSIIDIRVFNYFSHTQDMNARFLIADIANAIAEKIVLHTSAENIIRDYLHPEDFHLLVTRLLLLSKINCAVDCFSKTPIDKFSLLSVMNKNFGLQYKVNDEASFINSTGKKTFYLSLNHSATEFGYFPKHDSLDGICKEFKLMNFT